MFRMFVMKPLYKQKKVSQCQRPITAHGALDPDIVCSPKDIFKTGAARESRHVSAIPSPPPRSKMELENRKINCRGGGQIQPKNIHIFNNANYPVPLQVIYVRRGDIPMPGSILLRFGLKQL